MKRTTLVILAAVGLGTGTLALVRSEVAAQDRTAGATAEARQALSSAQSDARRARERAALLDRQAQASLRTSDEATLIATALAARVQQAEAALEASQDDLILINSTRRTLDSRLARESSPVTQLLAGLQISAQRPPVLQLLKPGSLTDAIHLRAVLNGMEPQVRARTTKLRGELTRARALERDRVRVTAQRRAQQADLIARRGELASLSAVERLKARRAASAADREAERAYASGAAARDLTQLVRRLEAGPRSRTARGGAASTLSATGDQTAPYRLPVQGRPASVQSSPRGGLTLDPRPNALVIAPGAGRVAFAGPYRGFGIIVIVEHADGWTSLLTSLGSTQVVAGQRVVAGSPLGQAPARDPSITIELRRGGVQVNPATRLR